MKQVLQHFRTGQIEVADIPCPMVRPRHLLIQTSATLISPGTERMLVEFGQAGLLGKARAQPERVRQAFTKIKTDGLVPTLEAVFSRLEEPFPLGYSNVGRILEVGAEVDGFAVGDRVVSNGAHAEIVCVPATLAAKVPDSVDDESASFAVAGAIALNGIRLLQPQLGESCAVIGLGLLGMLAVQLLRAQGCRVLGIDLSTSRCEQAGAMGCEAVAIENGADPVRAARAFSHDRGVDAVLITASARTDTIVHEAAQMCRKRGRIVLIGVVGLQLQRSDFYEKELSFQVACASGPGRHDPSYEEQGRDYPLPFVRWTAARNLEAVLEAMAERRLDARPLISRRVAHADASRAYDSIVNDTGVLGVVLTYPTEAISLRRVVELRAVPAERSAAPARPVVGVIGAGAFTKRVLLPAIHAAGGVVRSVASASGLTSLHAGRKFGAREATSDYGMILESSEINAVFIATRHADHPRMVGEALANAKHVFVEKPLALDSRGLDLVRLAHERHPDCQLMVGFNRRFAPLAVHAKELLRSRSQPVTLTMMVNAGELPAQHWTRNPAEGGGRIIGEACHFIDLALFLVGHPITRVHAAAMATAGGALTDTISVTLTFSDGSLATIHYWTNGPQAYPKERIEIFNAGRVLVIDNWRSVRAYDWPGARRMRRRQDKGHRPEVAAFLARVAAGGAPLIPFAEIEMVTLASFAAMQSAQTGNTIELRLREETHQPTEEVAYAKPSCAV